MIIRQQDATCLLYGFGARYLWVCINDGDESCYQNRDETQ